MAALLVLAIFASGVTSSTSLSITSLQTLHTFEVQQNGSTLTVQDSQNPLFNMTGGEVQEILTQYQTLLDQLRNTTMPTPSGFANTSTYTHIQLDESSSISISNITLPSLSIIAPAGAPTCVSQDTSYGNLPWSDLDGVKAENGSCAYTAQSGTNYYSYILKTAGYSFSIPATATVTGIKVEFKCYATASGTQVAVNQLCKASGQVGQSRTGATLPTSLDWMSYGNATDLWGATWSPSDVNDNGFGLGLAFSMPSGGVYVDAVGITVYYLSSSSQSSQTLTCGLGADDASVGAKAWNNPTNIDAEDGVNAWTSDDTPPRWYSHYLKATGFGFSIPSGATILGIQFQIKKYAYQPYGGDVEDWHLYLLKAGVVVGNDKADVSTQWSSSNTWYYYGGSSDLWGASWTPDDINNANFGVEFACTGYNANQYTQGQVDAIKIQVWYQTISGQGPSASGTPYAPTTPQGSPTCTSVDASYGNLPWGSPDASKVEDDSCAYTAPIWTAVTGWTGVAGWTGVTSPTGNYISSYAISTPYGAGWHVNGQGTYSPHNFYGYSTNSYMAGSAGVIRVEGWFRQYDTFSGGLEVGRRGLTAYLVDPNNPSTILNASGVLSYTDGLDWVYRSVAFSGLTPGSTYKLAFGRWNTWAYDWSLTSEWAAVRTSAPQSGVYYYSNILKTAGYGFNVPATATITGIKVEFKCYATASGTQVAVNQLYKASGAVGQSRTLALLNTSLGWMSYGGPGDLWGAAWSPSDVNDNGFGLGLAFRMLSGCVYVDAVRITVYYTSPPSGTPNTQTFLIISYRSNSTSYFVRITTVALFANGAYQSCATFLNYGSAQFNATHWVGDYLIFNFTHTLSQHYSLIADALISIVNNTYAPLAQQNQTAYQLVIAYTALSEHAGRLADFTVAHLQAYNRQIIQATVLATDPPNYGEGVIWDGYIPLRGGGVVPTGGSGTPQTSGSQGVVSMPTSYVCYHLTIEELTSFFLNIAFLSALCFLPSVAGILSDWRDIPATFFPIVLNCIASMVTAGAMVLNGTLNPIDFVYAFLGSFIIPLIWGIISYVGTRWGFWGWLAAVLGFGAECATGIGIALAVAAWAIGVVFLLATLVEDARD